MVRKLSITCVDSFSSMQTHTGWYPQAMACSAGSSQVGDRPSAFLMIFWLFSLSSRITLGNQLDGIHLLDPDVVAQFKQRYPDGIISKPKNM